MANELVQISELEKMARAVAASKLFGVKTPDEAMALMLIAQAEGMHPMTAVQEFDIIQGRPARKAWAMLGRFQAAGGKVDWHERTDTKVSATFTHSQGGSVRVDWDIARATRAGLAGKATWKQYPRNMLTARVVSEGVRTVFPGATGGFYTPEEVRDMDVTPPARKEATHEKTEVIDAETGEVTTVVAPKVNGPVRPGTEAESDNPFGFPEGDRPEPTQPPLPSISVNPPADRVNPHPSSLIDEDQQRLDAWGWGTLEEIAQTTDATKLASWAKRNAPSIDKLSRDLATKVYEAIADRKRALGAGA